MQTHCEICGNADNNKQHVAREMMFGYREAFEYLECSACGCLQNVAVPADLGRYYGDGYYSVKTRPRKTSRVYEAIKSARTRAFLGGGGMVGGALLRKFGPPGLADWVKHAGARQDSAVLELGCGTGAALLAMRSEGFTNLTGADPFISEDIHYGPGLNIHKSDVFGLKGRFDFIVLEHAFEHIPSQRATLDAMARLLAPNGTIVISIPVLGQAWQQYGVNWFQVDAPRHLFIHSEQSFRLLAKNLKVSDVVYDSGAAQFWASEQYVRDIPLMDERSYRVDPAKSMFTAEAIADFARQAAELNRQRRGDQATFYLRA